MMKWYQNLYVGESARKKQKKIVWNVKHRAGMMDVYLITLASNGVDLLDIVSSAVMMQKVLRKQCPLIVGIACGYEEAVDTAISIVLETYRQTGNFRIKEYLNLKVEEEII